MIPSGIYTINKLKCLSIVLDQLTGTVKGGGGGSYANALLLFFAWVFLFRAPDEKDNLLKWQNDDS